MLAGSAVKRFRIGDRVAFIHTPMLAQDVPVQTTGRITGLYGYRAFEITCEGVPIKILAFPENLVKIAENAPMVAYARKEIVSRRKPT